MASLQEKLEQIVSESSGTWGIVVHDPMRKQTLVEINPDQEFEAASVAKLSIVLSVLDLVGHKVLGWNTPLELANEHKRGGTGVLRHFPAGYRLTLSSAIGLMLAESDNTATNLVLTRIAGGQRAINTYLEALGLKPTGLVDRNDGTFESAPITPLAAMSIFRRLHAHPQFPAVVPFMYRSHFTHGLRRQLYPAPSWARFKAPLIGQTAVTIDRLPGKPGLNSLLKLTLHRRTRSLIASKEGSLDYQGESFRHEVALVNTGSGPLLAAAFSHYRPALGYGTDHPALITLGHIGREINNHR